MNQQEKTGSQVSFRRRRLLATAAVPLLALAACSEPQSVVSPRKTAAVQSPFMNNDLSKYSADELQRGQLVREDLLTVFNEFVPEHYLNQGLDLQADGVGYWASHVRGANLYKGEYSFDMFAEMGKDGQPYAAAVYYDENWRLQRVHVRAGNIPAYIDPGKLPAEVPGFSWLEIPPTSLRTVAEMTYNLPPNLNWQSTTRRGVPYMSSQPERDFARLEATGIISGGRALRFGIDEQSFSGLNVESKKNP